MVKGIGFATNRGKRYEYACRLPHYNLMNDYTMNGKMTFCTDYSNELEIGRTEVVIVEEDVDILVDKAMRCGVSYFRQADELLYDALSERDLSGMIAVVYGCDAWIPAILLSRGVCGVVLVTQRLVRSEDERILVATPDMLKKGFADIAVSICSIQHLGLGRFGEDLEANADIDALDALRRACKKKCTLFLSVPCGVDSVVWNQHRIYGKYRIKRLLRDWDLDVAGGFDNSEMEKFRVKADYTPLFIAHKADRS